MSEKQSMPGFILIPKSQRTISSLLKYPGTVYVYLKSSEICEDFYRQAESEGFRFGQQKPTEKNTTDIIRLYHNRDMSFCGFVGHLAFDCGSGISENGDSFICRIDYSKYIAGETDYLYYRERK